MRRLRTMTALVAALTLLTLAVGVLGWQQRGVHEDRSREQRDTRVVLDVSRSQVIDLTTLSAASLDASLTRMVARTTGDFKKQLRALLATFAEVVTKGNVITKGTVDSVGVEQLGSSTATVLVASTANVTGKSAGQTAKRTYRLEVKLTKHRSDWLISSMRFVQ